MLPPLLLADAIIAALIRYYAAAADYAITLPAFITLRHCYFAAADAIRFSLFA